MCDERGSEPGLKGAPCFALSVLVRERYPDATVQLVADFENAIAKILNADQAMNAAFFRDPVQAVAKVWGLVTR